MKPKNSLRNFLLLAGSIVLTFSAAKADILYWDGNVTQTADSNGGTGTWDTSLTNWDTAPFAGADDTWSNSPADFAVFGSASGTVTLGEAINVSGLRFDTSGYTIAAGASGLNFAGATNTVTMGSVAAATISGSVSSSGNFVLTGNPIVAGTLNFTGTNTTGWAGTTTVNAGMTLAVEGSTGNRALGFTSGITLNGGSITTGTGVTSANSAVNFFNDSAAITVNGGGSLTYRPINAGPTFLENIGAVTVNSGQMSFATGTVSSGSATLAIPTLTRSTTTSNLVFSTGNGGALVDGNVNRIQIAGSGTTTGWTSGASSNSIIGSWATSGTGAGADYAVFSGNNVVSANTIASDETNWTGGDKQYTLTNAAGSAVSGRLTATRNITALRNTTAATAATATNGGTANLDFYTLAGNTFANGDIVSVTGTGGTAAGVPYYVVNVGVNGANTFQISTTPNLVSPTLVNLSNTTAGQIAGGVTLSAGNSLGTTGILNANAATLAIGGAGGSVTLPTTTNGNLFVNATAGAIAIDAPVTDNGAGVLTLVKAGAQGLRLSGTNTYTGGTVINAGVLTYTSDAALGTGGTRNITFGGAGGLASTFASSSLGQLTVNTGALGTVTGTVTFTSTTGAGGIVGGSATNSILNLGDASAFTGSITKLAGGNVGGVQFSSLSDASGAGNLIFAGGTGDSNQRVSMIYNGTSALEFNNRSIELLPRGAAINWSFRNAILENNSADSADTWVINTNLVNQTDRKHEFTLSGSNTGNNEFAGVISDSARGTLYNSPNPALNGADLNLYKTGAGKWIVSGENTFTGRVLVNQGTLSVETIGDAGVAGNLGKGSLIQLGGDERWLNNNSILSQNNSGTLEYTGAAASSNRVFEIGGVSALNGTGGGTIANNGTGGLTFTAAFFNNSIPGVTVTRTLTLAGDNTGGANEIEGVIRDHNGDGGRLNITKDGGNTWILSGANDYSGTTNINDGTLIINGNSSTATGLVTVGAGGTIGGIGTVGGVTLLDGTLSPGQSPGTLTFSQSLDLQDGSNYIFEGGDLTVVGGTLNIAGSWTLTLGAGLQEGGFVTLFEYGDLAVNPNFVPAFDLAGLGFSPTGPLTLTDTGTSIVLNGVSVIPEPNVAALIGAFGGILLLRRRR